MSTLTLAPASVKATRLEIRNATYEARPIDPGFAGVAAVEVTKLVSGESYAVVLQADGHATCECPDFICRHADHHGHCKHIRGVLAAGLLVAPVSGGSPAAEAPPAVVRPWTEAERKRAAYFHLNAPKSAPAPAPALEAAPEIPAANSRDSWPAWVDDDRWMTAAPAAGLDLTAFASTHTAVGDEVPSPVYTMPALGGPVVTQPELVGLPPALPPMAWVEVGPRAYQMVNLTPDRADYRDRNAALDRRARGRFVPTAEEEAEAALLLADNRSSCLAGESSPPIGDRGVPRRPRPAYRPKNDLTDADIWPGGYC